MGHISEEVAKFVVNAQLLTLPSEDNKRRWFNKPVASGRCKLLDPKTQEPCGQAFPTSLHVLTGCRAALEQGRYTWRHNSVLLVLKQHLVKHITDINAGRVSFPTAKPLCFRRDDGQWYNSGGSRDRQLAPVRLCDYLSRANDWQIFFDLPGRDNFTYHVFPPEIVVTNQRPDVVLLSRRQRWVLCLELTCPKEERIRVSHELKASRYYELAQSAKDNGWSLSVWPIEVGCRGFVALSTMKAIRAFRFPRAQQSRLKRQLELVSMRCTYYIWCSRAQALWEANRPLLLVSV